MQSLANPETCFMCQNAIAPGFYYRDDYDWFCESCAPKKVLCKSTHLGCPYIDFPSKKEKHEIFFCTRAPNCGVCEQRVACSILRPVECVRSTTCKSGETFRAYVNDSSSKIMMTDCGPIVADYKITSNDFYAYILAPVPSYLLHKFKCTLTLVDPITKIGFFYVLRPNYSDFRDWWVNVNPAQYPVWSRRLDVTIKIEPREI